MPKPGEEKDEEHDVLYILLKPYIIVPVITWHIAAAYHPAPSAPLSIQQQTITFNLVSLIITLIVSLPW